MNKVVISVLFATALAGCSNQAVTQLSEKDNWAGLASYDVEAGNRPRSAEELDKLGASSAEAQQDYLTAYQSHMKEYCNPDNAYKAGILGKPYNAVCIDDSSRGWEYKQNWETGLEAGNFN